jgi:hypothetical protein
MGVLDAEVTVQMGYPGEISDGIGRTATTGSRILG